MKVFELLWRLSRVSEAWEQAPASAEIYSVSYPSSPDHSQVAPLALYVKLG